jgi:hypothetical protein
MMSGDAKPVPWEGLMADAAYQFGKDCARLRDTNPYGDSKSAAPLEQVIRYMATELWDQNFGVDEIKAAFEAATNNLPRYSCGYNKRSDEPLKRTR